MNSVRGSVGHSKGYFLIAGVIIITIAFIISLCTGSIYVEPAEILRQLFSENGDITDPVHSILFNVRLPRSIAAVLCGVALSVAGLIMQGVLDNPLASPGVIGVNAGAGLGWLIFCIIYPMMPMYSAIGAFIGAILAALTVWAVASVGSMSRTKIILAGVALSSIFGAFTDTILTVFPDLQMSRTSFLIGGFNGVTIQKLYLPGVVIVVCWVIGIIISRLLNVLMLGGDVVISLGLKAGVIRGIFIIIAAIMAGAAVSFSGLIGFVGLIVPHLCRRVCKTYDNCFLIIFSGLIGGAFTLFCDTLSRSMFSPFEVSVGIVLSFIGAPFFLYLLFKRAY